MKKNICIFISRSSKPDLYINVIVYLIARYKKEHIDSIHLIDIYDYPLDSGKASKRINSVKSNIKRQVQALSEEAYYSWNRDTDSFLEPSINIEVDEYFKEIYKGTHQTIERIKFETKVILDEEIEKEIVKIVQSNVGEYIFDLTGLVKKYFVSVAMFLQENGYHFSTFEVVEHNFRSDHRDLIHSLKKIYINYSVLNSDKYTLTRSDMNDTYRISKNKLVENKVKTWKSKVAKGDIANVLEEIKAYLDETNNQNFDANLLLALEKRFNDNKVSGVKNLVTDEDFKLTESKIVSDLFHLMDSILHTWD